MTEDIRKRIGHAVQGVIGRARDTFLEGIDSDQLTALTFAVTDSIMKEVAPRSSNEHFDHTYLSTACLHFEHRHCQAPFGCGASDGGTRAAHPASCEFCQSPCVCICHVDLTDPEALRAWISARRDPDKTHPRDTTGFSRALREDLIASTQETHTTPTEDATR